MPLLLTNNNRKNLGVVAEGKLLPSFRELFAMLTTFGLTVFAWIFFRAENVSHAFNYIGRIFSESILSIPLFENRMNAINTLCLISIFLFVEWFGRSDKFAIEKVILKFSQTKRVFIYILLAFTILIYLKSKSVDFIYFQF